MSFSEDIRSEGGFQRQFGREKRRIQLSEVPKSDRDSLQTTVVQLRTYNHFIDLQNTVSNVETQNGPHEYIFEPDYNNVKVRTTFGDPFGSNKEMVFQTLNGNNFYSLELYDQAASSSRMWHSIAQSEVGFTDDILNTDKFWKYKMNFHPPQLRRGNSVALNIGDNHRQFVYMSDNISSNFPFTANNFTISLWFYPDDLTSTGIDRVLAFRPQDGSNEWAILIDSDNICWSFVQVAGVETKAQVSTPVVENAWNNVVMRWDFSIPDIAMLVNGIGSTTTTESDNTVDATDGLYFGSYPTAQTTEDFKGYITGISYYSGLAIGSSGRTSLYNNNTISDTATKPWIHGLAKYG